jgi:hypothetical protein
MNKQTSSVIYLLSFLFAISASAQAQAPSPAAQIEEMKKINFLAGEWRGEGWIMLGPNKRETFKQSETVQSKLGGLTFVVEGLGKSLDGSERVVHNALAVISYDLQKKGYRFSAYQANGQAIDAEAKIAKNTLEWGFQQQYGTVRFTIHLTEKGEWHEIGEITRDGNNWSKFFEMTLQKVK